MRLLRLVPATVLLAIPAAAHGLFDDARRPLGLVLSGPPRSTGACGERFGVSAGRVVLSVQGTQQRPQGTLLYDVVVPVSFHFDA